MYVYICSWICICFGMLWEERGSKYDCFLLYLLRIFSTISLYAAAAAAKSLQSCPTLCNPIDGSPPGSAIAGILQARALE